jgi:uncharacterized protein (DUF2384 family)
LARFAQNHEPLPAGSCAKAVAWWDAEQGASIVSDRQVSAANEILDWAHDVLGLAWAEVASAVGADRRTVERWRRGLSTPDSRHRQRIADMHELRQLLEVVLPEEDSRREWLGNPVPFFRGHSPISMIRGGRTDDVIGVLAGVYSGAFL